MNLNLRRPNKKLVHSTQSGLSIVLLENTWIDRDIMLGIQIKVGWGNGYVDMPRSHPMYGKHYDEINVDVHGGLTYAEEVEGMWRVGFDTAHLGDCLDNWPKRAVLYEAERLMKQLEKMYHR